MDEQIFWQFRFKDGFIDVATNWTPEKVQRAVAKHGPLIGISRA